MTRKSPKPDSTPPTPPPARKAAPKSAATAATAGPATRSRRAPDPAERQRDADRTRQRILDAAMGEFADKGFAGARVREIAERAGVNAQLISYYFGGKEGLYEELVKRWHERERNLEQQGLSFADLAVAYLHVGFEQPDLMRMFIWENLTRTRQAAPSDSGQYEEPPEIADLRRRQANGEIDADIDVACLLVAVQGAVSAPTTMPQEVERLCGLTVDSDEFQKRYSEQMRIILQHLAASPQRSRAKRTRDDP